MQKITHIHPQIWGRIETLNAQLESFAKLSRPKNTHECAAVTETLSMAEIIKHHRAPDAEITARLRACALKTSEFSPVITAHLELMAEDYDPATQPKET